MTAIGQTKSTSTKEEYIESIDALFLKLELAYHYQFYKVFGTDEKLKEGKKLWAVTLKNETPEVILEAVESVIYPNQISFLSYDLVGLVYYLTKKNSLDDVDKIFNQKNVFKGKTGIFEIKDNTRLDARKPLNKSLFNKLRKKHKV